MPCLIAHVLARRRSRAAISASMSERTVAMADCSERGGIGNLISDTTVQSARGM